MKKILPTVLRLTVLALLLVLVFAPHTLEWFFAPLGKEGTAVIYDNGTLAELTFSHLEMVALSLLASVAIGLGAGILVTRASGAEFLPLSRALANVGQTFPPVAVLALAVTAVGFGLYPTLIALALYGLLPVFENTVAGLKSVPESVVDAAQGMGMAPSQRLWDIELPLALPLIIEGIKVATVISIGTATIGATVGAKCLGEVIMAGISISNTAYVLQGGLIVGLMAVLIYDGLGLLQSYVAKRVGVEVVREV